MLHACCWLYFILNSAQYLLKKYIFCIILHLQLSISFKNYPLVSQTAHLQTKKKNILLQDTAKKFKGDVMDLRLDIERRKRFAGKERDYKREGGRSPEGSRGPSRERSSEKSGKHHKKSKYVKYVVSGCSEEWLPLLRKTCRRKVKINISASLFFPLHIFIM